MTTGVFFHDLFSKKVWHIINDKFQNFPDVMMRELELPNVKLFTPKMVDENLLLKVHTERFIADLKEKWYCEGAFYTIGGCIEASELIMEGFLKNAIVFGVAAGHHAERNSAWGGTYASVCGPVVYNLQHKYPNCKVAILDTDSHHGNGTRDMISGNRRVLHVCFCSNNYISDDNTKICINSGYDTSDEQYLSLVKHEFISRLHDFNPDIILHLLGHDTAKGDYGDRGLSKECFSHLVKLVKESSEICDSKYFINTHGGSSLSVCEYVYKNAIRILAS